MLTYFWIASNIFAAFNAVLSAENMWLLSHSAECQADFFSEFLLFYNLFANNSKIWETRILHDILPILHVSTCDNYFIVICFLKLNMRRVFFFTEGWCRDCWIQCNTDTFYFHILIQIFCTLFICSVFDAFL